MMEDLDGLKDQLLDLVNALEEEEEMDLSESHPLFKWSYPERPEIQFQLLILQLDEDEIVPVNNTIH